MESHLLSFFNYIAVTFNQMLCGVNFPSIFSKGHNPLQFETQEGLIYLEISISNFYLLAQLVDVIISILLTFWIVVFLMLIQKNDKFISQKNMSQINTSGQEHDASL